METLYNLALTVPEAHKIEDLLVEAIEAGSYPFGDWNGEEEDLFFIQNLLTKIYNAVLEV